MALSVSSRKARIQNLKSSEYDLLIIGGGISGAGVARDAASRGMTVALIEADDFASGTSSRSSKLIHGGIRYLENLEFGLVFEALRERRNLFSMAPHLVHPLRFVLPVYKESRVGMFKMGLGMWLYDILSLFEAPKMHERLNKSETLERVPMLNAENLCGSYVYSDAYMDDDRLVIETLRSAERLGAEIVNYTKAFGAEFRNGKVCAIKCQDTTTNESLDIRAKHFVSTVGPWTDSVASEILKNWKPLLRPSKGVHLTFPKPRMELEDAVVMISADQKRIVFGIPRHEMIIIGTTDTDFRDDPRNVHTSRADIDYLLSVVKDYFPNAQLSERDILASYSGVRPLVHDGSDSESKTSREHLILSDPRNITFLTGGKYTTYRQMAQDTMNVVLQNFTLEEMTRFSKSDTLQPLNPKATETKISRALMSLTAESKERKVHPALLKELILRHGEEAYDLIAEGPRRSLWEIEAAHAIRETMCMKIKDFYLRRSPLALSRYDHGLGFLPSIANVFKAELGLSEAQIEEQIKELNQHFKHEMSWQAN